MDQTFPTTGARVRYHILRWRAAVVRPFAKGSSISQFVTRRIRPNALNWAAGTALTMGILWILLEYALRGGQGIPRIDLNIVKWLGASGLVFGLATRARISMSGELSANAQTSLIVLLVTFVLPAAMLLVYAGVALSSAGLVSLSWALWLAVLLFAVVLQIAVYMGLIGSFIAGMDTGPVMAVVSGTIYTGAVCFVSKWATGRIWAAWDFTLPNWANARRELIPDWMFVISLLRERLAPLDHMALMSVLASVGAGTAAALLASLAVRSLRRALMTRARLRVFLPMAGAPVADNVPIVHQRMLAPLLTYALIGWGAVLVLRVF